MSNQVAGSGKRLYPLTCWHQPLDLRLPAFDHDDRTVVEERDRRLLHEKPLAVARHVERQSRRVVEVDVKHRLGRLRDELGLRRRVRDAVDPIEDSVEELPAAR